MENKLRECFEDMVVYKDLKKSNPLRRDMKGAVSNGRRTGSCRI